MPVKKASQPKPGLQRTAFLRAIASKDGVTHEHALQLAGLAPASGFTLGSTAAPPFGYPSSSPTAGPSRSRLADVKGKGKSASPIEISDSEDDRDGGRGGWTSSAAADDGVAASYQPHVCSRTKCAGNPNCLQYLGQEKWTVNTGSSSLPQAAVGVSTLAGEVHASPVPLIGARTDREQSRTNRPPAHSL